MESTMISAVPESLFDIARFSENDLLEFILVRHFGGSIRHRMPLHCEFMPLLFGGQVGRVFGVFFAPNRFQKIFSR
jgi:hypothetical protein